MLLSIISNSKLYSLNQALIKYIDFLPDINLEVFGSYENKEIIKNVKRYKFTEINDKPDAKEYRKISSLINPDSKAIFVFSTRLITADIFSKHNAINFHPSKLPQFTGLEGFIDAINNKHLGFSSHIIDSSVDLGKLLSTFKIEPFPDFSIKDQYKKISSNMCSLMILYILFRIKNNNLFVDHSIDFVASSFYELENKVISEI